VNRGYSSVNPLRYRPRIFYDFQVAILRTNKTLHEIARSVFATNHVIHISSSDIKLFKSVLGFEAPAPIWLGPKLWTRHIEDATDIRMNVFLDTAEFRQTSYCRVSDVAALMLLETLEDLVAIMAAYEILVHSQLRLSLCIEGSQPQPLKLLRALLEPFTSLHGIGQTCKRIRGPVDASLARRMKTCLTAEVHWYRATKWLVYQSVLKQAKLGDEAYLEGRYALAVSFYLGAGKYIKEVRDHPIRFDADDDAPLSHNYDSLSLTMNFNAICCALLACQTLDWIYKEECLMFIHAQPIQTDFLELRYLFYGMACLGLKKIDLVKPNLLAAAARPEFTEALLIIKPWEK